MIETPTPAPSGVHAVGENAVQANGAAAEATTREPTSASSAAAAPPPPPSTPSKNKQPYQWWMRDTIVFQVPMEARGVDLAVGLKQTRQKRIQKLREVYPELEKASKEAHPEASTGEITVPKKKHSSAKYMPQMNQYGNVLDYLEAKYVQGVQFHVEENSDNEGEGSVYESDSVDSFLDDTDLFRNVAEQVLAQSTATKLELQTDNEFFVNVGDLEVEESEWTQENYDPLNDTTEEGPKKRKRKTDKSATSLPSGTTKKAKMATSNNKKSGETMTEVQVDTHGNLDVSELQAQVTRSQEDVNALLKRLTKLIKSSTSEKNFPRRKKSERVSVVCEEGNGPGDKQKFKNPFDESQLLMVTIPPNIRPGGTFRVSVPIAANDIDPSKDYNNMSKELMEAIEEYATSYDDMIALNGKLQEKLGNKKYSVAKEKQRRFDDILKEFPSNLKTPVDRSYLQLRVRRVRKNRSQRSSTKAKESSDEKSANTAASPSKAAVVSGTVGSPKKVPKLSTIEILLPVLSNTFPTMQWAESDFIIE